MRERCRATVAAEGTMSGLLPDFTRDAYVVTAACTMLDIVSCRVKFGDWRRKVVGASHNRNSVEFPSQKDIYVTDALVTSEFGTNLKIAWIFYILLIPNICILCSKFAFLQAGISFTIM